VKHSRFLTAIAATAALAAGALVGAVPAASAGPQPITVLSPAPGEQVDSAYPDFSWQAPVDAQSTTVDVSAASTVGKNGFLTQDKDNYVGISDVRAGVSSYQDKKYSYSPGTYYWRVTTMDDAGVAYASEVQKFVVPMIFDISKAKASVKTVQYSGKRGVIANAVMQCNFPYDQYYTQFRMDVYRGKKLLSSGGQARGDCVGMRKTRVEALFEPPASMPSGTKLTLKIYGAYTHGYAKLGYKKMTGPKTTLTVTWKK
jgi:hypothetical protein